VTESFWEELGSGKFSHLGPGRLVSSFQCDENWTTWEMHPHGEELVYLLAGAVELVLSNDEGENTVHLKSPGSFVIVPRGTWHTANVLEPSSLLFITPGEGTEHKAR
jgi:mannose-6-phosphate isomerase-like protein (cupin superfamily)